MARPTQELRIDKFLGRKDSTTPAEIDQRGASDLRNLLIYNDYEKLYRRKGYTRVNETLLSPSGEALQGIFWFKNSRGENLIGVHDRDVLSFTLHTSGVALASGSNVFTDNTEVNGVAIGQYLYLGNAQDGNQKTNGTAVYLVAPNAPTQAPTAALGSATGLTGTYNYRYTYIGQDGETETAASSVSNTVTPSNQKIDVTVTPSPASGKVTATRLYRNRDGETSFFLVTTLSALATAYTDNIADASLGAELRDVTEDQSPTPPMNYLQVYRNRLCGASGTTLLISNENEPWITPESTNPDLAYHGLRLQVADDMNSPITGLKTHGSKLVVFTGSKGFLVEGSTPEDFFVDDFTNHGCVAHRTLISAQDVIIWLSGDGVYMAAEGQGVKRISDDITQTLNALTAAQMVASCAWFYDGRYYLSWDSNCFWYDLKLGQWGRYTNWFWRHVASTPFDGTNRPRLYGARVDAGRVFQLENGVLDDVFAIEMVWTSKDLDFGSPTRLKRMHFIDLKFLSNSSGMVSVYLYRDTGVATPIQALTHTITGGFDNFTTDGTLSKMFQDCTFACVGEYFRIQVVSQTNATFFEIADCSLSWTLYK